MSGGKQVYFPPFTLDISNQHLRCGSKKISLRPKSFTVLAYLAEHPHRLIGKDELMSAVWPKAKVVDAALRVSIQEIRKALGDGLAGSKFIETVGKNGYRFISPVSIGLAEAGRESFVPFVGRTAELELLRHHLDIASSGKRQFVFVTGEPGIGKTTLVEAFLKTVLVGIGMIAALGLCIEQFGTGEAYLPVLDLLERMCKSPSPDSILDGLRQYAPSWLAGLPMLVGLAERTELARQTVGTTPERRMREIAGFLEDISKTQTIVLVLEDLHWADPSTLALISFLARRREAARLMTIGTYREDEVERSNHPLKNVKAELQAHNYCTHLRLKLLSQNAVGEYLAARFETDTVPKPLLSTVYRRSEGNPLFMVNVTDYLVNREAVVRESGMVRLREMDKLGAVPETIRDLMERQVAALPQEEQELLELASVAGTTFSVAVIARVLDKPREEMEDRYRQLAERGHYLQYVGLRTRTNGRGSPRYSFVHALYQNVIYDRIDEARRKRLHQAIGERTEAAYQGATDQVAAELALHFDRSGDNNRAAKYLLASAQIATQQSAYQEALSYCEKGLVRLESCEHSMQRREMEIRLHLLAGVSLTSIYGYASEQVHKAFTKAQTIIPRITDNALAFQTLAGIWSYNLLRGELRESLKIATIMLGLAQRGRNWSFLLNAHMVVGCSRFYLGNIRTAHTYLEKTGCRFNLERFEATNPCYSWNPGIVAACYDAMAQWMLGYPNQAEREAQKALAFARALSSPVHSAIAGGMLSVYYTYRGDVVAVSKIADTTLTLSVEHGFYHWLACGEILKGWALVRKGNDQDGVNMITDGISKWESTGAQMLVPTYRLLQAEAYLASGHSRQAETLVEQCLAMSKKNRESYYDAELYRLRGEIRLRTKKQIAHHPKVEAAEADILRAVQIAKRQKAKSLELRATVSLCRLWQKTGKEKAAHRILAKIYGWFTEGFDTPDLKDAKRMLDELS